MDSAVPIRVTPPLEPGCLPMVKWSTVTAAPFDGVITMPLGGGGAPGARMNIRTVVPMPAPVRRKDWVVGMSISALIAQTPGGSTISAP